MKIQPKFKLWNNLSSVRTPRRTNWPVFDVLVLLVNWSEFGMQCEISRSDQYIMNNSRTCNDTKCYDGNGEAARLTQKIVPDSWLALMWYIRNICRVDGVCLLLFIAHRIASWVKLYLLWLHARYRAIYCRCLLFILYVNHFVIYRVAPICTLLP